MTQAEARTRLVTAHGWTEAELDDFLAEFPGLRCSTLVEISECDLETEWPLVEVAVEIEAGR